MPGENDVVNALSQYQILSRHCFLLYDGFFPIAFSMTLPDVELTAISMAS